MKFRKTLKTLVYGLPFLFLVVSCTNTKSKSTGPLNSEAKIVNGQESEGYELTKVQCYACHNPNSPSHDEIIAPPLAAVKMRYQMQYKTEAEFVEAMVEWAMDPQESRALMRGAVVKFKTMPKQLFKEVEIRKIATYIYNNKLEEPDWFAAHQKEMHKNGRMGNMIN
jgi:mono/diheme cytochrome c family protein